MSEIDLIQVDKVTEKVVIKDENVFEAVTSRINDHDDNGSLDSDPIDDASSDSENSDRGDKSDQEDLGAKLAGISISSDSGPLENLARKLSCNHFKNVIVLTGAGVSVSAGIPDFRTPGTGLYDNLQKYDLPYPEAVFDLDFYKRNPRPFLMLAKELWPRTVLDGGTISPTLAHCFLRLLEKKDCLLRCYTQNIDGLEVLAGVSPERVMECHGHFRSASCIRCKSPYDGNKCRDFILNQDHVDVDAVKAPRCLKCKAMVKPDIVFFGEGLPSRFFDLLSGGDCDQCDLLIVMGTSLMVYPVASIPEQVTFKCPRLLINRELVGTFNEKNDRDIFHPGNCDDSVRELCSLAGWENDLYEIYNNLPKPKCTN